MATLHLAELMKIKWRNVIEVEPTWSASKIISLEPFWICEPFWRCEQSDKVASLFSPPCILAGMWKFHPVYSHEYTGLLARDMKTCNSSTVGNGFCRHLTGLFDRLTCLLTYSCVGVSCHGDGTAVCRNGPRIQRHNSTRREADLCVRRGDCAEDHCDHTQGVRRRVLRHELQTHERWHQLRVADGRGRRHGSQGHPPLFVCRCGCLQIV